MRDRAEDSLLSRILLLLWLPLAALVGLVPLEEERDDTGLSTAGQSASVLTNVRPAADSGADAPPAWRPVSFPAPVFQALAPVYERVEALEPVSAEPPRTAYTRLLRRQLLRIPDPSHAPRA